MKFFKLIIICFFVVLQLCNCKQSTKKVIGDAKNDTTKNVSKNALSKLIYHSDSVLFAAQINSFSELFNNKEKFLNSSIHMIGLRFDTLLDDTQVRFIYLFLSTSDVSDLFMSYPNFRTSDTDFRQSSIKSLKILTDSFVAEKIDLRGFDSMKFVELILIGGFTIPNQLLMNYSNIETIVIDGSFKEIPDFVFKLKNLKTLELHGPHFLHLPVDKIKTLKKLEYINLDYTPWADAYFRMNPEQHKEVRQLKPVIIGGFSSYDFQDGI